MTIKGLRLIGEKSQRKGFDHQREGGASEWNVVEQVGPESNGLHQAKRPSFDGHFWVTCECQSGGGYRAFDPVPGARFIAADLLFHVSV